MSRKARYAKADQENGTYVKTLTPKNSSQEFYMDTIREMTVTLCTGPAGTGKTYLATYVALEALLNNEVDKVVLTRPMIACEDVGYLPGDMMDKIHPYLMPLFDAIESHVGPTKAKELLNFGRVEVLPLAYMRGRSLNRAFVILDEAQNTATEQMKMFLTRLGYDSKMVVNGDAGQSDLPKGLQNGLNWAVGKLLGVDPQIGCVEFSSKHIVRNPLISKMLQHLEGPDARPMEQLSRGLNGTSRHDFYDRPPQRPAVA